MIQNNVKGKDNKQGKINRRSFLAKTTAAVGGIGAFTIVPRYVLGGTGHTPPSEKLNIAIVGCGGQGRGHVINFSKNDNLVALCDVDFESAADSFKNHPNVNRYKDFRVMLDKQGKDIDAVVIATADHVHAFVAMAAMQLGKHVYCEKPLTHSIYEVRQLAKAAEEYKVATQMGNQGHAGEGRRLVCEWVWDGALGDVREVCAWTDRPIWPQGIGRPQDTPPVPENLDWDLWIGPAPMRPYHSAYHPFSWRGWADFGTGAFGDMACHILDIAFSALKLGFPESVEASTSPTNDETYPVASIVRFKFPAREGMPPVKVTWYDGGLMPERPDDLEPGRDLPGGIGGSLFIGEKAKLTCGCYGDSPRIIPETKMKAYTRPAKTLPRSIGHREEWIRACKGGGPAGSNFSYSTKLTEMVLLGAAAQRLPNRLLRWNAEKMEFINEPEANALVRRDYRQGWSL